MDTDLHKTSPFNAGDFDEPFVFLMATSPEDRCRSILENLIYNPRFLKAFILNNDDSNDMRRENLNFTLNVLMDNKIEREKISYDYYAPLKGIRRLVQKLELSISELDVKKIVFDISCFTRRDIIMLLHYFENTRKSIQKIIPVDLVYSEPESYISTKDFPLTRGTRQLGPVPGLPQILNISAPPLLIMFLGHDGDRPLAVYEEIEPALTYLLFSESKNGGPTIAEAHNEKLIQMVGNQFIRRISPFEPLGAWNALNEILTQEGDSMLSKIVVPLGTKPQAVGVFDFWKKYSSQLCVYYASPLYRHPQYSVGKGAMWSLFRK